MLKSFRYFLIPLSIVYGMLLRVRNFLFDKRIIKSVQFNFPIVCIGNIAMGGTGKTPMAEFLIEHLKNQYKVATLSRGYKRRTKGFAIANESTTALEIGDEPMQFHQKFPEITVAVGEERIVAVPQLLHLVPATQVIILDDAFQHRSIQAGLNILLTDFSNLFTRDLLFPAGDLRDIKKSASRADIIVVTKCPSNLSVVEKNRMIVELDPLAHQQIYFTTMDYGTPYQLFSNDLKELNKTQTVILLCAIANPLPIKKYLNEQVAYFEMLDYRDHHIFSTDDLMDIKKNFSKHLTQNKIILTTEKDAVRLQKYKNEFSDFPIYVLPVKHRFLFDESESFMNKVLSYINQYDTSA